MVDCVVKQIRDLIQRGSLGSGHRLPGELVMARQFQVSRPVLREALKYLEAVGLLVIRRGQGVFVGDRNSLAACGKLVHSALSLNATELIQIVEFRRAVECYAVRRAVRLLTDEDLHDLDVLAEQIDVQELSKVQKLEIDFQFHLKLLDRADNELIYTIMVVIQEFVKASILFSALEMTAGESNQGIHLAIVKALRTGKPDLAERAMHRHMDWVVKKLEEKKRETKGSSAAG
jgi:GntR family transcriptional regulator, transcriptional repressor for pyruvate dehydrogenase complex